MDNKNNFKVPRYFNMIESGETFTYELSDTDKKDLTDTMKELNSEIETGFSESDNKKITIGQSIAYLINKKIGSPNNLEEKKIEAKALMTEIIFESGTNYIENYNLGFSVGDQIASIANRPFSTPGNIEAKKERLKKMLIEMNTVSGSSFSENEIDSSKSIGQSIADLVNKNTVRNK